MTWLKVSDRDVASPEFNRVSRDARLMHVEALAMSMSFDGTGAVSRATLRRWTDADDPEALAAELVAAGLWIATGDGWRVDYMMADQMKPDEIARQRDFNRARQERARRHARGDHSDCDLRYCRSSTRGSENASRNASRNASGNASVTVPRPDPTRPKEGRKGSKARASASGAGGPSGLAARRKGSAPAPANAICWACGRAAPDGLRLVPDDRGYYGHPLVEDDDALDWYPGFTEDELRAWRAVADPNGCACAPTAPRGWFSCAECDMVRAPSEASCPGCGAREVQP